ncbi:MAG: hypothetical protein KF705_00440 [Phycisphaeraceae bacterium]|nr:hypothetical protein [Phycisphaeraceae bacterium]
MNGVTRARSAEAHTRLAKIVASARLYPILSFTQQRDDPRSRTMTFDPHQHDETIEGTIQTDAPPSCADECGCPTHTHPHAPTHTPTHTSSSTPARGRFVSPFKVTLALGLATLVGSVMVFKPDPQGVLAGDAASIRTIPAEQLRQIVLESGAVKPTQRVASESPTGAGSDSWRSIGTLESEGLLIRIEARENRFGEPVIAYTAIDRTGTHLATRVTIEDLKSLFPKLDWDSLTASGPGRLMLADDPDRR